MILDCTSHESTKASLIQIFNTTEEKLTSTLKSLSIYNSDDQSPEEVTYSSICDAFGAPSDEVSVIWFHGTRVEDEKHIYHQGILPKSSARQFIEPRLNELAKGLESSGENPFALSILGKQGPHDEGPFAFLFRNVAIHAPGFNRSYTNVPEMVEDISGSLLGENYKQLVKRFQEVSKPCVVSFLSESKGYELPHALYYLKLVEDGELELEAGSAANTFFDSEGRIISSDRIQAIELI